MCYWFPDSVLFFTACRVPFVLLVVFTKCGLELGIVITSSRYRNAKGEKCDFTKRVLKKYSKIL
jgi:hypothetical protein